MRSLQNETALSQMACSGVYDNSGCTEHRDQKSMKPENLDSVATILFEAVEGTIKRNVSMLLSSPSQNESPPSLSAAARTLLDFDTSRVGTEASNTLTTDNVPDVTDNNVQDIRQRLGFGASVNKQKVMRALSNIPPKLYIKLNRIDEGKKLEMQIRQSEKEVYLPYGKWKHTEKI